MPRQRLPLVRREDAFQKGVVDIDLWLIDCQPVTAQVAQRRYSVADEALKALDDLGLLPATACFQPQRVTEVMQADHGADATRSERSQDRAIPFTARAVKASRLGLNAAPLHAQAVRVQPHVCHAVKVSFSIGPPVAGRAAFVLMPNRARLFLCRPPLIVAIPPFHLVRR